MTRSMKITLFGIAFFFLAVAGSFIWFVATWDPEKEEPVVRAPIVTIDQSRGIS